MFGLVGEASYVATLSTACILRLFLGFMVLPNRQSWFGLIDCQNELSQSTFDETMGFERYLQRFLEFYFDAISFNKNSFMSSKGDGFLWGGYASLTMARFIYNCISLYTLCSILSVTGKLGKANIGYGGRGLRNILPPGWQLY